MISTRKLEWIILILLHSLQVSCGSSWPKTWCCQNSGRANFLIELGGGRKCVPVVSGLNPPSKFPNQKNLNLKYWILVLIVSAPGPSFNVPWTYLKSYTRTKFSVGVREMYYDFPSTFHQLLRNEIYWNTSSAWHQAEGHPWQLLSKWGGLDSAKISSGKAGYPTQNRQGLTTSGKWQIPM